MFNKSGLKLAKLVEVSEDSTLLVTDSEANNLLKAFQEGAFSYLKNLNLFPGQDDKMIFIGAKPLYLSLKECPNFGEVFQGAYSPMTSHYYASILKLQLVRVNRKLGFLVYGSEDKKALFVHQDDLERIDRLKTDEVKYLKK